MTSIMSCEFSLIQSCLIFQAKNPEELLSMTKKGQTLMMFVNIRDPSKPLEKNRPFTSKYTEIFQSMLRNNHINCQVSSQIGSCHRIVLFLRQLQSGSIVW